MPDVGMSPPRQTHTSTQEWQSFEIRMRRRRAERCLLRAETALEAGFEDDARAALDEARQLDWQTPDFDSLKARLDTRRAAETAQHDKRRRLVYLATAVFVIAVGGGTLFITDRGIEAPPAASIASVPAPPAAIASAVPSAAPPTIPATSAPDASQAPLGETASTPAEEKPASDTEPRATKPGAFERGDPKAGTVIPERTLRNSGQRVPAGESRLPNSADEQRVLPGAVGREVEPLPSVAVPTTSAPVPQQAPNALSALGRGAAEAALKPIATSRVPDLPPAPAAAPEPAPPPRADPAPAPPPDEAGVRAALSRYESAYSSLNASAAHTIYPGVDERSLERAFESLDSQRVSLGRCSISMNGARAQATCQGSATWTPKVGGGTQHSARTWRFDLANTNGAWTITRADAR